MDKRLQKILVIAVLGLVVLAWFAFGPGDQLSLAALKARQADLAAQVAAAPGRAALVYCLVYVLVAALSLPGAALLTLVGGAIFGLVWGTLLVSFASSLGATLAFLTARFLLRDWVAGRFGARLQQVDQGMARDGAFYLFTLRLIPVFPFFLVNLLFGLTALPVRTFYWVSQLGMLAGTVVYVNAGTRLAELDSLAGILSPPLLLSFALLGVFPLLARRAAGWLQGRRVYAGWPKPARFDYNLVVIGGGSAGLVSAYLGAAVRAKVALVEEHALGGDCLNTGCVPSKALLRSARLLAELRRAPAHGVAVGTVQLDFAALMQRVQDVIAQIAPHDSAERYRGLGVEVLNGRARLLSPWTVEVTAPDGSRRVLGTRAIVLATGARPTVPPIPGLAEIGYLTSDTVWALRELPRRLLVLGGGPIGCELAQAFARIGAHCGGQVTLVELAPRLLPREDDEVSELVADALRRDGVDLRLAHRATAFVTEGGEKILLAQCAGAEQRLSFDAVLVAVGRSARLEGYGLEELGIEVGATIATNACLQTRFPNIYAAGDVAGPFQFTHTAAHQAWYAAVNALFSPLRTFRADYSVIPAATFVEPELARVGLNEREAAVQGVAYEVSRFSFAELDRAITDDATPGFVKVLTVPGKDRILGATIVGPQAGELIAEYVLAMKHRIGVDALLATIHVYPTLTEANKYVAGVWKKDHAPQRLLAWLGRFHAWRRGG